jgi:hypothetical protein
LLLGWHDQQAIAAHLCEALGQLLVHWLQGLAVAAPWGVHLHTSSRTKAKLSANSHTAFSLIVCHLPALVCTQDHALLCSFLHCYAPCLLLHATLQVYSHLPFTPR